MTTNELTRSLATVEPLSRARSSGRFQRLATRRWRESVGAPARVGRPPAVTPELGELGKQLLREGSSVAAVCERLGVDRRSWYRFVHREAQGVRTYRRRRRANAVSTRIERQMLRLDRQGLPRVVIAERLGLHINTVVKYLLRAGRPRRRALG